MNEVFMQQAEFNASHRSRVVGLSALNGRTDWITEHTFTNTHTRTLINKN